VKEEEQSKKKEKEALIDDLVGTFCVSVLGCWWHKSLIQPHFDSVLQ
jgi:hypothetical protein